MNKCFLLNSENRTVLIKHFLDIYDLFCPLLYYYILDIVTLT